MMGGVNNSPNYYHDTMKFGYPDPRSGSPVITDSLLQGGIVSFCRNDYVVLNRGMIM
jgi:hypothetical protein